MVCCGAHMKTSGGLWSFLDLASSVSRGVGVVVRAALLMGHMGSWLPHTKFGLQGGKGGYNTSLIGQPTLSRQSAYFLF